MNDRFEALSRQIEALNQGLTEAQKLLQELAKGAASDPKADLIHQITARLPQLTAAQLQSTAHYVAFLASPAGAKAFGGPGGGENQPPTGEGGP